MVDCNRPSVIDSDRCDKHQVYAPKPKRVKLPKPELEKPIKARIRAAVINAGCIAWIHDVDNRQMKTGLAEGCSDIICIVPPFSRFLAIEVKRPRLGVVSEAQRCFLAVVRRFGGVSGIATSEAEALALVEEARQPVRAS